MEQRVSIAHPWPWYGISTLPSKRSIELLTEDGRIPPRYE